MPSDSSITIGGRELDPVRGGLLFLVVGLAIAGYGGFDYNQQQQALDAAEPVNATVLETGVETESTASSSSLDYHPTVRFEYTYQGERYTSTDVYPATVRPSFDTESAARDVIADYDVNSTVTAYTTADAPAEAFLRHEQSNGPYLALGIGGVMALLGGRAVLRGL